MSTNINNAYEFFKNAKFDEDGNLLVSSSSGGGGDFVIPAYTTANRPNNPIDGTMIRDIDLGYILYYENGNWKNFSGAIVQ